MTYSIMEGRPIDNAKAEYELALYKADKKAAEFVEQYLEEDPSAGLSGERFGVNAVLRLLAVI